MKLIYNIMKGTYVIIKSVIISKVYKVMLNSEELIGSTAYRKQQMSCPVNWCHINQVWLYLNNNYNCHTLHVFTVALKCREQLK